jgi:peptidoglycan lytic transglycosylase G
MAKWKVAAALGLSAGIVLATSFAVYYFFIASTAPFIPPRNLSIGRGESLSVIANRLERAGVVRSSLAFVLYAELTGKGRDLKPGDYAFKGGENPAQVLHHLVHGDFIIVIVTIPEGTTVHQIAQRLQQAGLACEGKFEQAARSGPLPMALGLGPLGAEGYLFPATYRFAPREGTQKILAAMLERFFQILTPAVEQRLFELNLTARQLVTLASMIEKEAKVPGERPIIASVFYNRLRLGMPLQSDPTAQYNPEGKSEPAAEAVRTPSAFNTYTFTGLPPGPIANPGLSSIEAALYPAHTDYLYFVARDDGTHIFSRSFKEHERAIALIRRKMSARSSAGAAGTRSAE